MSVDGKKGGKQSRFSTLRVFGKFGKTPGPPPPPPKDAVYLAASNRSLASLSPNESSPASPLSGEQYAASSSSAVSLSLSSSQHSQKTQRSGLFKFATVRKPPSEYSGETSPGGAAEADEGISMPWNFQHNVHVDEGFTGLPPSWTTSLQEAGFSDDEIAAIQQRKMADRPPRDRTNSPPAVVKPVPRTTSLPKNQQQQGQHTPASSLSASSASISSRSSPSPAPDSYSYGSPKIEYASPNTKISPVSPPPVYYEQQLQSLNAPPRRKPPAAPREDSPSRSPPPSRSLSPPQQRAFSPVLAPQVHSRSGSQQSSSSRSHSDFDDDDDERVAYSRSRSRSPSPPPTTTVTAASPAKSNGPSVSNLKNLTLDLGLDISLDGTGWSDAVLSATSLKPAFELNENNNADRKNGLNAAKSPTSPLFTLTAPGKLEEEYSPTELFYPKKGGREREVSGEYSPTGYYGGDYDYDERDFASPERSPASPAFSAELLPPAVGSRERDNRDSGMSDATMLPPQTPLGGARSTMASTRTMDSVGSGETDMNTSPGTQSRPPSTGVVSRIAVARRAVAEVVGVPAVPRAPPPSLPPPSVPPPAPPTRNVLQPPASPQSSNFGSSGGSASGSSESQDHQTPTTEVEADEDDTGELDYYLEGKNYLEKHGFKLEGAHRPRGEGHARTDTRGNGIGVNGTTNTYASAIAEEEKQKEKEREREWVEREREKLERERERERVEEKDSTSTENTEAERTAEKRRKADALRLEARRRRNAEREAEQEMQEQGAEEQVAEAQEEEDEEEIRRKEWEAMQRGEEERREVRAKEKEMEREKERQMEKERERQMEKERERQMEKEKERQKTKPAPIAVQSRTLTPPTLTLPTRTPPTQAQQQSRTSPTQSRTPPTQSRTPPTQSRTPRSSDRAHVRVSAANTFGHEHDGEDGYEHEHDYYEELHADEFEYGYALPEDDRFQGIAGAVESPNPGAGGYGSAFGSPSGRYGAASPKPSGYGGSPGAEPRRTGAGSRLGEEYEEEEEDGEDEEGTLGPKQRAALGLAIREAPVRPQVITSTTRGALSPGPLTAMGLATTPMTPAQRYAGWIADAVAPLEEYIDELVDPREFYGELQEIAEGESGSVYAATVIPDAPINKLHLPPLIKARDADTLARGENVVVAIKFVELVPGGSQKLVDVRNECALLNGLRCEQVLGLDALYVDVEEDSLWIRMELMERSLADVVGLVDEGLRLQEPRVVARFANDMLQALDFLQKHHIAHRDVRSDNLLLNSQGILKLADFSNAISVTETPVASDVVGVMYWQAPEVRSGSYDPLKIDVWSVGATVWELAEAAPPFSDTQQPADRWPALSDPAPYPPSFHEFLRMCSEPAASRPTPGALLETPFVQKACGRPVIVQLLSTCTGIEQALHAGEPPDSPP